MQTHTHAPLHQRHEGLLKLLRVLADLRVIVKLEIRNLAHALRHTTKAEQREKENEWDTEKGRKMNGQALRFVEGQTNTIARFIRK